MNDDSKFCFWLKLNVGLIIPKEIQAWAVKKILEDHKDQFVIDICFLKYDAEINDYFNKLIRADLDRHNEQLISINILKEYISKKNLPNLDSSLDQYITDIELICRHINDSDLTSLLYIYTDQINLASLGYLTISVKEALDEFSKHLIEYLKNIHLT